MIKQWITGAFALGLIFLTIGCEQRNEQKTVSSSQEVYPVSSHYEELKSLEWMAGEWKDDEKDIDVTYSTEWGKNQNFLIQHFTSQMGEGDEIQGEQIIGWDPSEKKVRSWVFDSDGGFGSSTWNQEGSIWYSDMKFTLPDGRKASALHVYTKIDNDSYTFTSTNRDIGGEVLPDIGPFKIIRKK